MPEQDSGAAPEQDSDKGNEGAEGSGSEPQGGDAGGKLSPEAEASELARARAEAANYRTKLRDSEAKIREYEQAKLSETEKAQARIRELEEQNKTLQAEVTNVRTQASIATAASKLGFRNPSVAHRLVDAGEIEYDDSGKPTNVEALLGKLAKSEPYLIAGGSADGGAGRKDGGATKDMNSLIRGAIGRQS